MAERGHLQMSSRRLAQQKSKPPETSLEEDEDALEEYDTTAEENEEALWLVRNGLETRLSPKEVAPPRELADRERYFKYEHKEKKMFVRSRRRGKYKKKLRLEEPESRPINLGPNQPGRGPQRWGLLDFQDITLFLWPPGKSHGIFTLEDECIILKHRNPRLNDITVRELLEVKTWIQGSKTITVEGENVDIAKWHGQLTRRKAQDLFIRMMEDLDRARSILEYENMDAAGRQSVSQISEGHSSGVRDSMLGSDDTD